MERAIGPQSLLDVTDLVEFLQRGESVSGVQRVIAETAPFLIDEHGMKPIMLDRSRGCFVPLSTDETRILLLSGISSSGTGSATDHLAVVASQTVMRVRAAEEVDIDASTAILFLGAVWSSDALMLAARRANFLGARLVYLLYDLTPVLETGHTSGVRRLFERYLALLSETGRRVPAISQSSRSDFERYCTDHGLRTPPGKKTGLPCGLRKDQFGTRSAPWPRSYALFVGTVESRKNHAFALEAWRELIDRHGSDAVPDLVCVGRLGWHSDEFLREYVASRGLDGKLCVISEGISDAELACFYAHAAFTIYPSRYEGWGLPVSESIEFGKVPIVADNSSLREAGLDLAIYFQTDDVHSFIEAVETEGLNLEQRKSHEHRILMGRDAAWISWKQVAETLVEEIGEAMNDESPAEGFPVIELGREYVLAPVSHESDPAYSDRYFDYVQSELVTPLLRQPRDDRDFVVVDAALTGSFGPPQGWGYEMRPGRSAEFRFTRPSDGALTVLFATRAMPGVATVSSVGPGGPTQNEVYLGGVLQLPLGDGRVGEPGLVRFTVVDAQDSIEGFVGLRSFVVLAAEDLQAQVLAHKSAAEALRQELDFILNTRSWRATALLRRFGGRRPVGE
jgi:glycosyltransferase involved in cell wall biosynthesis